MTEFEELTTRAMSLPAPSRAELAELLIQSLEGKRRQKSNPPGLRRFAAEIRRFALEKK